MPNKEITKFILSNFTHDSSYFHIKKHVFTESYKLHWHNYFEIELILKGSGYEMINGKRYDVAPGLFYLLLPTDLHEVNIESPTEIITISFDYPIIPQTLSQNFYTTKDDLVFYLKDAEFNFMATILEQLYYEFNNKSKYNDEVIHNILSIILISIIRKTNINIKNNENHNVILTALNYINLHYNENPTLENIAKEVGFNPTYFSTAFKKYSGKTYSEYLTEVKISHAKKLLIMNQMSITDVAMLSGFNSISNFNKMFKKSVGCSPVQYRKENGDER